MPGFYDSIGGFECELQAHGNSYNIVDPVPFSGRDNALLGPLLSQRYILGLEKGKVVVILKAIEQDCAYFHLESKGFRGGKGYEEHPSGPFWMVLRILEILGYVNTLSSQCERKTFHSEWCCQLTCGLDA